MKAIDRIVEEACDNPGCAMLLLVGLAGLAAFILVLVHGFPEASNSNAIRRIDRIERHLGIQEDPK